MQSRTRDQLKYVIAAVVIAFLIVLVSVKVRNDRDTFVNGGGDPTFATPQPSAERSGTIMSGTMNPNGQAMLYNSIPTPEPCVVDGVLMPTHYKRPNKHQSASLAANNTACVIDVTYPGAKESCTDSQSTFYDANAVKSVNIVTDASDASSTMQCMVTFNSDVARESLQKYAEKNDMDAQKAMVIKANEVLTVQYQQVGAQLQQLQTKHQELQEKSGVEAEAARREILALRAQLASQQAQVNDLTQARDRVSAQLALEKAAQESVVNELNKQIERATAAAAAAAARVPAVVVPPQPVMNVKPGLKVQVSDWDAANRTAGALRFVTYGPKLYGMDLIQFPSVTNAGWAGDSWLAGPIHLRLDGFIEVPETREYTFNILTDDGARMTVDGQSYLGDRAWKSQAATSYSFKTSTLKAGKVPISIEYYDGGGVKELRLSWDWPAQRVMAPVPMDRFFFAPPSPPVPQVPISTTTNFRGTWSVPNLPDAQGNAQPIRSFLSTQCRSDNMTISFMLDILSLSGAHRNVLHVTSGQNLERRPAIWVNPNSTTLHICSDTIRRNADGTSSVIPNVHFNSGVDLGINTPTLVVLVYKGRNLTYYFYNRGLKVKNRYDYRDDIAPASQGGFNVYASSYYPVYDTSSALRLKDLKFFNMCLTDSDVTAMYNVNMYDQA